MRCSCRQPRTGRSPRDRKQHIAELGGRRFPDLGLQLAADHRAHTDAARLLIAVPFQRNRMQALLASSPAQPRQLDAVRVEPCGLIRPMAVKSLLNAARPAAAEASRMPTTDPRRRHKPEHYPGTTIAGVF